MGQPSHFDLEGQNLVNIRARMKGALTFQDPVNLRINSECEGRFEVPGRLAIGPEGKLRSHLTGDVIVVEGKVEGEILARRRLEIRESAVVTGKITAPTLVILDGAVVEAEIVMLVPASSQTESVPKDRKAPVP